MSMVPRGSSARRRESRPAVAEAAANKEHAGTNRRKRLRALATSRWNNTAMTPWWSALPLMLLCPRDDFDRALGALDIAKHRNGFNRAPMPTPLPNLTAVAGRPATDEQHQSAGVVGASDARVQRGAACDEPTRSLNVKRPLGP